MNQQSNYEAGYTKEPEEYYLNNVNFINIFFLF